MCGAQRHVRFTPNSDRESEIPQLVHVGFGPEADITELGFHQRLDFTSLIVVFVAPLPFHCSPLSSSPAKQLG